MGDYEYTLDELLIRRICEACWYAILSEEVRHYEEELPPLTEFQKELIYQRYRDKATDLFPHIEWERMYDIYDGMYKEVEEEHQFDATMYA